MQSGVATCHRMTCDCEADDVDLACCPRCDESAACPHQEFSISMQHGETWVYQCQICECLVSLSSHLSILPLFQSVCVLFTCSCSISGPDLRVFGQSVFTSLHSSPLPVCLCPFYLLLFNQWTRSTSVWSVCLHISPFFPSSSLSVSFLLALVQSVDQIYECLVSLSSHLSILPLFQSVCVLFTCSCSISGPDLRVFGQSVFTSLHSSPLPVCLCPFYLLLFNQWTRSTSVWSVCLHISPFFPSSSLSVSFLLALVQSVDQIYECLVSLSSHLSILLLFQSFCVLVTYSFFNLLTRSTSVWSVCLHISPFFPSSNLSVSLSLTPFQYMDPICECLDSLSSHLSILLLFSSVLSLSLALFPSMDQIC